MTAPSDALGPERPFAVAVLSGKGGVGKTTISLSLARQLSRYYPVWLLDIDLFNRGTTSAIWASESSIPLSLAELIRLTVSEPQLESELVAARLEEKLKSHLNDLTYSSRFAVLPAARAEEGREASFILWHGMTRGGKSAHEFLDLLAHSLNRLTPGCILLFDGHGGLDDLSIGAAVVSDVTMIVNEPDLITFTGSITLYHEISRTCQSLKLEPLIEFVVNRVPPNKSLRSMEEDFGDVLRTISPSREPIAVYFPLERELFGVFGDDPFVSEIFTEYWFSKKVRLLARHLMAQGKTSGRLRPPGGTPPQEYSKTKDAATRTALRREFHKRSDTLLMAWLVLFVVTLWILLNRVIDAFASESSTLLRFRPERLNTGNLISLFRASLDWPLVLCTSAGLWMLVQSYRWAGVQWRHLRNARAVRARHGRWRRLGDSASASLRERIEVAAERRGLWRGLRGAAIAVIATVGLMAVLVVPNFLDALEKAKQKRTEADIRFVGTAMFSWLTDQVGAAAAGQSNQLPVDVNTTPLISNHDLTTTLVPQYAQSLPTLDGWKNPYEYRMNRANPLGKNGILAIRSPGRDGKYEGNVYTVSGFDPTDYDQDIVWEDGYFVRWPQRQTQ